MSGLMIHVLRNFANEIAQQKAKFLAYDVFKDGLLHIPTLAKNVSKMEEWKLEHEEEGNRGMWLCLSETSKSRCSCGYRGSCPGPV